MQYDSNAVSHLCHKIPDDKTTDELQEGATQMNYSKMRKPIKAHNWIKARRMARCNNLTYRSTLQYETITDHREAKYTIGCNRRNLVSSSKMTVLTAHAHRYRFELWSP